MSNEINLANNGSLEGMIGEFNHCVIGLEERDFGLQPIDEHRLTLIQLREEIDEFELAYCKGDLVGCIDGLEDLIYFAVGALLKFGCRPTDVRNIMEIIHNCNMQKQLGKLASRKVDGDPADAVKPEGWTSPEENILKYINDVTLARSE